MRSKIITVLSVLAFLGPVAGADAAEISCTGPDGLKIVFAEGSARLDEGGRTLTLRPGRAGICFTCAGLPRLDLTLKADDSSGLFMAPARGCASASADVTPGRQYCLDDAGIRLEDRHIGHCSFPEGTTLGALWTVLFGSLPPDTARTGWHSPE